MRRYLAFVMVLAVAALAPVPGAAAADGRGDATVIAVIDTGFSPYHWDFLASRMPQALDGDPSNDLPLDQPPHTWLSGFPDPSAFSTYDALDLTLEETNPAVRVEDLMAADADEWATVRTSAPGSIDYYWMPGTKVVGALTFGDDRIVDGPGSHGMGSASVSTGNRYGTCPECLLVFIQLGDRAQSEAAIEWAESQPWIDAITNSYGFSLVERDRLYSGSDTEAQRVASERGQTIFFSAGNGYLSAFLAPNTTLFSSQEGPDWIVTVGAVRPADGAAYSGAGKPVDIAGVGSSYPSSYGASTVGGNGFGFGGTSNATPTIAGMYGRALWRARALMAGASRAQSGGVVATGSFACGVARPDCELGDGVLTAVELRARLFGGAVHTEGGTTIGGNRNVPPVGEEEFVHEGHGTYFARARSDGEWLAEFARIEGPLTGSSQALERPSGEREWMIVDSYCRQHLWGAWSDGAFVEGVTALPAPSPTAPLRSLIQTGCPALFPPV